MYFSVLFRNLGIWILVSIFRRCVCFLKFENYKFWIFYFNRVLFFICNFYNGGRSIFFLVFFFSVMLVLIYCNFGVY